MLSPAAYYNENDEYAAEWLRNLIDAGHIARGVVDTRSIEDVHPRDLDGYTQCHFFAGIGVWSYALRLASWPDDRPVWTGSCPCQPFSEAGKGLGFADERHLWPAWFHLIGQRRPAIVFGEQVASPDIGPWLDLVQDDLEGLGHAFGAVPFPASGVGAPHIRDRLYWVADANAKRYEGPTARPRPRGRSRASQCSLKGGLANAGEERQQQHAQRDGAEVSRLEASRRHDAGGRGGSSALGHAECDGLRIGGRPAADLAHQPSDGPLRGYWANAEWIACRDGKWRPIEPGSFPLAHGAPARVGRLRAYGNAICAPAAAAFVKAFA